MLPILRLLATPAVISFLYFALAFGLRFLADAIEQPRPPYHRIWDAIQAGMVTSVLMFIIVPIDLGIRYAQGKWNSKNTAYYPRFQNVRDWLISARARWTIAVGSVLLAWYYARGTIEVFRLRQLPGGLVWAPERLFLVLMLEWGLLWFADCIVRPKHETIFAAVLFMLALALYVPAGVTLHE